MINANEIANRQRPISPNNLSKNNKNLPSVKLKAEDIYADIKNGANAWALMDTYQISITQVKSILNQFIKKGVLKKTDLSKDFFSKPQGIIQEALSEADIDSHIIPANIQQPSNAHGAVNQNISRFSNTTALLLCLFLGGAGAHRFYVGKTRTAILMLLTLGGFGIWALIDFISILTGKFQDQSGLVLAKLPNAAVVNCNGCGQTVSASAKACPSCGMSNSAAKGSPLKIILYVVGGFFALGIIGSIVGGGDLESNNKGTSKTPILLQAEQKSFIDSINSFSGEYYSAPNELKKSAIRTKRRNAIRTALNGNLRIRNWIGTLELLETNSDGKAIVSISLPESSIRVQTWNNALSDTFQNTLIEQNTQLFQDISELSEGNMVVFSGTFVSGDNDYIEEQSMTEEGAMAEPEFTFRFDSVKKFKK